MTKTRWIRQKPQAGGTSPKIALLTQLRRIGGQTSGGMVKTRWSQWWQLVAVSCPRSKRTNVPLKKGTHISIGNRSEPTFDVQMI